MVNELDNKINDDDTKRFNFFSQTLQISQWAHQERERLSELNRQQHHHHGSLLVDG
jgi:hypothetical protein